MTLNPTLNATPGFGSPVVDDNTTVISNVASAIFGGSRREAPRPTEAERKNSALKPIADALADLQTMDIDDVTKRRRANSIIVEGIRRNPELSDAVRGLGKDILAIEEQSPVTADPYDAQTSFFNEQINTPEGQAMMQRAMYRFPDDPEAAKTEALKMMYTEAENELKLKEVQRKTSIVSANRTEYITVAQQESDSVVTPMLRKQSLGYMDDIIQAVERGDVNLDTPQEQLRELMILENTLRTQYINAYEAVGIPPEVYTKAVEDALQPISSLRSLGERTREDFVKYAEAVKRARELGVQEVFIEKFGALGAHPDLQKALFEDMASRNLGEQAEKLQEAFGELSETGFVNSWQFINTPPRVDGDSPLIEADDPVAEPEAVERAENKTDSRKLDDIQQMSHNIAAGDGTNTEGISVALGSIIADADSIALPLSSGVLQQVLSPKTMKNLRTVFNQNTPASEDLKRGFTGFVEKQIQKNFRLVDNIMSGQVDHIRGRFKVAFVDGKWGMYNLSSTGQWRQMPDRMLTVHKEARTALENMNRLFYQADLASGGAYSKEFVKRSKGKFDLPGEVTGGSGVSEQEGSQGQDTLQGSSLIDLIDRTEAGGGYSTLFGYSNRSGPFSNVDVSRMTIGEAIEFSSPNGAYGQWVKGQIGRVATPMGRFQIVGTTLRQSVKEMGLSEDTLFDENTQNAIFAHLADKRLAGKTSAKAKRDAMRQEWEGFKHVSDAELDAAIAQYEQSGAPFFSSRPPTVLERPAPEAVEVAEATPLPETSAQALETPSQAVSEAPVEQTTPTTQVSQSDRVAETEVLSDQSRKLLRLLNREGESLPSFNSEEEARASGLPEDSLVLVQGEVMIL